MCLGLSRGNIHLRTAIGALPGAEHMASLNQAWNIATGALAADQAAIAVVASNIANANTPGYTTEVANWGSADTVTVGGQSVAGGVTLQGLSSQRDPAWNRGIDSRARD